MRRRAILYILPAVAVMACERVTAPKALEIADKLEQNLRQHWSPISINSMVGDFNVINEWFNLKDRSTLFVARDGPVEQVGVVVVERVFIPPGGYGAPLSRRSLVAFRDSANFGILAVTQTNADDRRGVNSVERFDNDELNPRPALAVASPNQEDWWTPRSGKVLIEPVETGARCPLAVDGGDVEEGRVSCNLATYDVQLEGEFVRQSDAENSLLPEALKPRHHLSVPPQHVNGIRFTIHCPDKDLASMLGKTWYGLQCVNGIAFWRSNDQFARALDVDVSRMEPRSQHVYVRTLRRGSDTHPPNDPGLVRYTLSYPDGSIVARDTLSLYAQHTSFAYDQWLFEGCAQGLEYGERRQCLVSLGFFPKGPGRLLMGVVDLESVAK